jgi:hypothetical protein
LDEYHNRITYYRGRVNPARGGPIKYINTTMLEKSGYKYLDGCPRERQRILQEISKTMDRANSDVYQQEMSPCDKDFFLEGPPPHDSRLHEKLGKWLERAHVITHNVYMRIYKYETLQKWVNIFEKQKHLLHPEAKEELMEQLSWAVRLDIPTGIHSEFFYVSRFEMDYLPGVKDTQRVHFRPGGKGYSNRPLSKKYPRKKKGFLD